MNEKNFSSRYILGSNTSDEQTLRDFAACIQSSIVRHIETRVHRAILFCETVQKPQWKRTLVIMIIENDLYSYVFLRFRFSQVVCRVISFFDNEFMIFVLIIMLNLFVHHHIYVRTMV